MKTKILVCLSALAGLFLMSCSEDSVVNNYDITIENVEVKLNTQELITESSTPFQKSVLSTNSETVADYSHLFPTGYKAYFVSKENKGNYTIGQVVAEFDVVSGGNTIVVPKLDYSVYVTNYIGNESQMNGKWYTWTDAVQQMPQTSQELYLFGKADINYATQTVGTVELVNHYAGVQIRKNKYVTGVPSSYDTNQNYFLGNEDWYVLYIRNNNTNTKVPVTMAAYNGEFYTLSRQIEKNKIYKFTINGDVENTNGEGNFIIEVADFEATYSEDVNILI